MKNITNNLTSADELRNQIELGKDLESLMDDARFKNLILDGYISKTLLVDSINISEENEELKKITVSNIQAVNNLRSYLYKIRNIAECAKEDLAGEH